MTGKSDALGVDADVSTLLSKVDIAEVLPPALKEQKDMAPHLALLDELPTVNSINGPHYMMQFLKAKEFSSKLHANAICKYELAHRERKKVYAICKFDRAPNELKIRNIRYSDSAAGSWADQDIEYLKACEQESFWKALEKFYRDKVDTFQSAHDDAKKIYSNTQDPRGSISGLPSGE